MGKPTMTLGDKAVATAALASLLEYQALDQSEAWTIAEALVRGAERAQYQSTTKRLVVTYDLSGPADRDEDQDDRDEPMAYLPADRVPGEL